MSTTYYFTFKNTDKISADVVEVTETRDGRKKERKYTISHQDVASDNKNDIAIKHLKRQKENKDRKEKHGSNNK